MLLRALQLKPENEHNTSPLIKDKKLLVLDYKTK